MKMYKQLLFPPAILRNSVKRHDQKTMKLSDAVHGLGLLAIYILCLAVFLCTGCSAKQSDSENNDSAAKSAGVLNYSGVVNGKVKFQTSDCTFVNGQLGTFNAPHYDESKPGPGPSGPFLAVTSKETGYWVNFTSDRKNATPRNSFIRMRLKQGISIKKVNGSWVVKLNAMRLYNGEIFHQGSVSLTGEFRCTNIM